MSDLTIKNTEVADDTEQRQLRLKLPAGVKGSDITISNDYVTQTVRIELPQTEVSYFENDRFNWIIGLFVFDLLYFYLDI